MGAKGRLLLWDLLEVAEKEEEWEWFCCREGDWRKGNRFMSFLL